MSGFLKWSIVALLLFATLAYAQTDADAGATGDGDTKPVTTKPVIPDDSDRFDCTMEKIKACKKSREVCGAKEKPVRKPGECCASCNAQPTPVAARKCDVADVLKCRELMSTLPLCADGEDSSPAQGSCCPKCVGVLKPQNVNGTDGLCTAAQVRDCFQKQQKCATDEKPIADPAVSCCASCDDGFGAKPGIAADLRCRVAALNCLPDETPVRIDDTKCPSCINRLIQGDQCVTGPCARGTICAADEEEDDEEGSADDEVPEVDDDSDGQKTPAQLRTVVARYLEKITDRRQALVAAYKYLRIRFAAIQKRDAQKGDAGNSSDTPVPPARGTPEQDSCKCGTECKMEDGSIGVCQTDNTSCAVNIVAPECDKEAEPAEGTEPAPDTGDDAGQAGQVDGTPGQDSCKCGTECKMEDGSIGVCQTDNTSCAVNIVAPECDGAGGRRLLMRPVMRERLTNGLVEATKRKLAKLEKRIEASDSALERLAVAKKELEAVADGEDVSPETKANIKMSILKRVRKVKKECIAARVRRTRIRIAKTNLTILSVLKSVRCRGPDLTELFRSTLREYCSVADNADICDARAALLNNIALTCTNMTADNMPEMVETDEHFAVTLDFALPDTAGLATLLPEVADLTLDANGKPLLADATRRRLLTALDDSDNSDLKDEVVKFAFDAEVENVPYDDDADENGLPPGYTPPSYTDPNKPAGGTAATLVPTIAVSILACVALLF